MLALLLSATGCHLIFPYDGVTTSDGNPYSEDGGTWDDGQLPKDGGQTCTPGALLGCQGSKLLRCSADGHTMVSVECGPQGCDPGSWRCLQCLPDASPFCDGKDLVRCSKEGLYERLTCPIACTNARCDQCEDQDGDGYGKGNGCKGADCDDSDAQVSPSAMEVCDGKDNNCDTHIDEKVTTSYYKDEDNDGYGDKDHLKYACTKPSGYVVDNRDCNDKDSRVHPGQSAYYTQMSDKSFDYNCNGKSDRESTILLECEKLSESACKAAGSGWVKWAPWCGLVGKWLSGCKWDSGGNRGRSSDHGECKDGSSQYKQQGCH